MGQCPCIPVTNQDLEPEEPAGLQPPQPNGQQPEEPINVQPPPYQPPPRQTSTQPAYRYTFDELRDATENFNHELLIREGASGPLLRGTLKNDQVAIQLLDPNNLQSEDAFRDDVQMFHRQRHSNLINLLGFCTIRTHHLLVFEYVSSDLESRLHAPPAPAMKPLTWGMRMKIAAGVAKGLSFLHNEADPPVIYGDLKSSNVLLLDPLDPKLFDAFRHNKPDAASASSMDSPGYRAPECIAGQPTVESDRYSFGILLLELMTGQRAFDDNRGNGNELLANWALPKLRVSEFSDVIDPVLLEGECPVSSLRTVAEVVLLTARTEPEERLNMANVVRIMDSVMEGLQVSQPGEGGGESSNAGETRGVADAGNAANT